MFRHKENVNNPEPNDKIDKPGDNKNGENQEVPTKVPKDTSPAAMRELLEKNLKWSQIIYEQNRKINNKLLWMAIGGWVRVLIILLPLVWAFIYLPPILKNVWDEYQKLLGHNTSSTQVLPSDSMEKLLKLFPLDAAQQAQINTLLKK